MSYKIYSPIFTQEGEFEIKRTFPTYQVDNFNPFLLLDHFGPTIVKPNTKGGVGWHPHRGFETVTLLLDGEIEHQDSKNNKGIIKPYQIQWMTAGDGVFHSEHHSINLQKNGGTIHGLQLWVNLPKKYKKTQSSYQQLDLKKSLVLNDSNIKLYLISGKFLDFQSPIKNYWPINYYLINIQPEKKYKLPITFFDNEEQKLLYSIENEINLELNNEKLVLKPQNLISLETKIDFLNLENNTQKIATLIFLQSPKLIEPVTRYGPFVMNTKEEIYETLNLFQEGRLG